MGMVSMGPQSAVMAVPDVRGEGLLEWETITGMPAHDPLVGSGSGGLAGGYDVDSGKSRMVTQGMSSSTADQQNMDWSDAFNWRHSPVFWVMVASILAFGLVHVSVHGAAGLGR